MALPKFGEADRVFVLEAATVQPLLRTTEGWMGPLSQYFLTPAWALGQMAMIKYLQKRDAK